MYVIVQIACLQLNSGMFNFDKCIAATECLLPS